MTDYIHVQTEDPGAVGAMHEWRNPSTGSLKIRNTSNTGWNDIGNSDITNLGLAKTSGFAATGAITGVSGWAPLASPDFSGTPKKSGISLATVNNVSDLRTELLALIDSSVSSALNSYTTQSDLASRIAIGSGVLTPSTATSPVVIPLPTFASDGATADESACKWVVAPSYFLITDDVVGDANSIELKYRNVSDTADVDPTTTRTFCCYIWDSGYSSKTAVKVAYMIIATR